MNSNKDSNLYMGNSNKPPQIEFFICSSGAINEDLLSKLFPRRINDTKRELNEYDMYYIAKLYSGNNHLNRLIRDVNTANNNNRRNNIILCFCDDNNNFDNHTQYWIRLINSIADKISEMDYPLVIILNPYENNFDFDQKFRRHQDKRTITILKIKRNNSPENIEHNYRLILSLFWEKNLYLNQEEIKPNEKNVNANFFRINSIEPTSSIKILETGFARKGKSTLLNLIFGKLMARESPQDFPLTSKSNEYTIISRINNANNNEEEIVGGLKIIDTPGLEEGNNNNRRLLKDLINKSIEKYEQSLDVINYILFFLTPGPNFAGTDDFLRFLNSLRRNGIKTIFIINRDMPRRDGSPNTTRNTLIARLRRINCNNLLIRNGENILEVNLIEGRDEDNNKINKIFNYIYDDLRRENEFITHYNRVENINDEQQLFNYLHNNTTFYRYISSPEDLIGRGERRANLKIGFYKLCILGIGFSPIPLIDIPFFFFFLSLMIVSIIIGYGIELRKFPYNNFFSNLFNNEAGEIIDNNIYAMRAGGNEVMRRSIERNQEEIERENYIKKILRSLLSRVSIGRVYISGISFAFIAICTTRAVLLAINGIFDLIGLFFVGGIICAIFNIPFAERIGSRTKEFCRNYIQQRGTRAILLNEVRSYINAANMIRDLSKKNEWERKVEII